MNSLPPRSPFLDLRAVRITIEVTGTGSPAPVNRIASGNRPTAYAACSVVFRRHDLPFSGLVELTAGQAPRADPKAPGQESDNAQGKQDAGAVMRTTPVRFDHASMPATRRANGIAGALLSELHHVHSLILRHFAHGEPVRIFLLRLHCLLSLFCRIHFAVSFLGLVFYRLKS